MQHLRIPIEILRHTPFANFKGLHLNVTKFLLHILRKPLELVISTIAKFNRIIGIPMGTHYNI